MFRTHMHSQMRVPRQLQLQRQAQQTSTVRFLITAALPRRGGVNPLSICLKKTARRQQLRLPGYGGGAASAAVVTDVFFSPIKRFLRRPQQWLWRRRGGGCRHRGVVQQATPKEVGHHAEAVGRVAQLREELVLRQVNGTLSYASHAYDPQDLRSQAACQAAQPVV